jgi:hypothetical protein
LIKNQTQARSAAFIMDNKHLTASCRCGQVAFEASGRPIVSTSCYCRSCQEAGQQLGRLPAALAVLDADGGTGFVLFRKDRVRFAKGGGKLQEHRLKASSTTRRVVATCCSSPMFLEFANGHWLSIYRNRLPEGAAPLELRVMTRDRRDGVVLPGDVPNYATHSGKFMWRLFAAWAAMGFRTPKVAM